MNHEANDCRAVNESAQHLTVSGDEDISPRHISERTETDAAAAFSALSPAASLN